EMKINEKWKVTTEQEFRWGDNASELFYQHYDMGVFYSFNKFVSAGGGYRHVLLKFQGKYLIENEPYLHVLLTGEVAGFSLESRNRFEYDHFDYQTDYGRYRNKMTMRFPWKFTKLEIQPFVSDEVFLRYTKSDAFNQNRFSAGFGVTVTKNIKGDIFYMLQSYKSGTTWLDANVFGTKLKIAF
ncbi:MAG: DUF2490 domain-containing protein, partial [Candidatus Omnitrophica bacterium]|nr:DUF2490 domain-containing protein [Candidatus Omnitrophota bacterium]